MVKVTLDAETFKALASPTRLGVMRALDERRKTVSELARDLEMNKATIHEHLQLLTASGLVNKVDEGRKWIYYELTWRGERILHPQETTTFNLLLGISVAAAGGGVMMMGRALGWWLNEQATRIPEQDFRSLEAANGTEELPGDDRHFTAMDGGNTTLTAATSGTDPADPSSSPSPTSTETSGPTTGSTTSGTSAPSTTGTTTSEPDAASTAPEDGANGTMRGEEGEVDHAYWDRGPIDDRTVPPEQDEEAMASDDGLADLSDDGLLALLLLAFSLLTSILALSLRRRLSSRPARPDEQPPEATGDAGLDEAAGGPEAGAPDGASAADEPSTATVPDDAHAGGGPDGASTEDPLEDPAGEAGDEGHDAPGEPQAADDGPPPQGVAGEPGQGQEPSSSDDDEARP